MLKNTGEPVMNVDLGGDDPRWPQFTQRTAAAGFRSVRAAHAPCGSIIGALNMFHIDTGHMHPADVAAAQALADVATIAIIQHRAASEAKLLNEQLSLALNTRIVIEQAKGMVAQRHGLDMHTAFTALPATTPAPKTSASPTSPATSPKAVKTWPPSATPKPKPSTEPAIFFDQASPPTRPSTGQRR